LKKFRFISILLIITIISQSFVFAAKPRELYSDNVQMAMVNQGKTALFEKADTVLENPPFMSGEHLMLPARYLFESYGYAVTEDENKLTAEGKDIFVISGEKITVNGEEKALSVPAVKSGDEFFIPDETAGLMGLSWEFTRDGVFKVLRDKSIVTFDDGVILRLQGIYLSDNSDDNKNDSLTWVKNMEEAKNISADYMREYGEQYKVRIFVKEGKYHFNSGVTFPAEPFGLDIYKGLSIEPYDISADKPVFTGSVELDVEKLVPVTDPFTLARIHSKGRGKVAELDLKTAGINSLEQLPNKFNYIYLDGIEQTNARWPNVGESTIFSVPETNSFTFSETDPMKWTEAKNAYVFGHFSSWGWEWHQGIIQSVNASSKTITIKGAAGDTLKNTAAGTSWYAQNLLEEIDMPGEWFVDTEALKLYYYPPYKLKGRKLEMTEFLGTILTFSDVSNLDITGINFTKCGQALSFNGDKAENVTISKNEFSHGQAKTMVSFKNGLRTYGVKILENKAYNLFGAFSYFRTGNLNTLKKGESLIKNNHIIRASQYFKAQGAIAGPYQTENFANVGVITENNVSQYLPGGAAIAMAGTWSKINNNEVINAGEYMDDYGAIYFGRSSSYFDMEVANNFLHHFTKENNYNALYNDDAFAGAYWHHNVCVDMYQPCIQAPGFNSRYMYNVAVNCAKTGTVGSRKSFGNSIHYGATHWEYTNSLVYANEEVYRKEYPQIFEWLERKDGVYYNVPFDSIFFGNIGVGSSPFGNLSEIAAYGAKEMERNGEIISIEGINGQRAGNPYYEYSEDIFVDPENMNYNINPESQAAKDVPELLEIDITKSGLTDDALYLMEKPSEGSHLRYPTNGIKGINSSEITFSWDPVKGATFYQLIVATDPELQNVVYDREVRQMGDCNQITLTNFSNDKVYYWKVVAKSIARQNQFEIDSVGGPYAFKTAKRDVLQKENLNLALTTFEKFVKEDLNSSEYEFDAEFKADAENKLEEFKTLFKNAKTQAEIDKAEEDIYYIIKKSPFFMKLHFENLNGAYDANAAWSTSSGSSVTVDENKVITFTSEDKRADAKVAIKNKNSVLCFKMKLADLGTTASNYQGFDIKLNNMGRGYLIIFKHDIIEWQRINVSLTEIPNDFIEAGKWYDVQAGGINTPNGVLQFFRVDGRIIYAELDQTGNQTRDEGFFNIRKNQLGDIQIKDVETVPADGIIIEDVLSAFKKPHSDKHLQTLLIGSADTMEMSSSQLFAKLDKAELAKILFPSVTSSEINISRDNITDYKNKLLEMCVISGYNQSLSELVFVNKTDFMYNDIIKVEEIDKNGVTIYAMYNTLLDKFRAEANELMLGHGCTNINELRIAIAKGMFAGAINACYTGFGGHSTYISDVLTKENADYLGIDISDYLSLDESKKLQANAIIGNGTGQSFVDRTFDELLEDIHEAVESVKL